MSAKTARVLAAGLELDDTPISLTSLSHRLAVHMGGVRFATLHWRLAPELGIRRLPGDQTYIDGTFLLAVAHLAESSVLCGYSRDGGVNDRHSACGCFANAPAGAALSFHYPEPKPGERAPPGVHNWGTCQQPAGAFWCDQLPASDFEAALNGSCRMHATLADAKTARPECGASWCAWRRRQARTMLDFQRRLLTAESQGLLEHLVVTDPRMARGADSLIGGQIATPAYNDSVRFRDFLPSLSAVLVPSFRGTLPPRAVANAAAAAREISQSLGRLIPLLSFEVESVRRSPIGLLDDRTAGKARVV
jgi:hypothetical protein